MDLLPHPRYAVIYIRVSTTKQTEEDIHHRNHVSLETQEELCRDYCSRNNLTIKHVKQEVGSATNLEHRNVLKTILFELDINDTLVFYNLSRLCRSVLDFLKISTKLLSEGKYIVSVKENLDFSTSQGRLFATILASFAQFESESIQSRVTDAMAYNKTQGKWQSRPPYGYFLNSEGYLERVEEEMIIIRQIYYQVNNKSTYDSIARMLNDELISYRPTKKEVKEGLTFKPWNKRNIGALVKSRLRYMRSELGHQGPEAYEILYSGR